MKKRELGEIISCDLCFDGRYYAVSGKCLVDREDFICYDAVTRTSLSLGDRVTYEAREKLEMIIIHFCKTYGFSRPRMYRRIARKNYLALAKAKKRSTKKIRATIRKQLAFIRRDTGYLENFMQDGYAPTSKESTLLLTIYKLYI